MVNLDKWEEIEYNDIEVGDKIRVIVTQGNVVNDVRGKVASKHYAGISSKHHVTFVTAPSKFNPAANGGRVIYRRKPKPFELPTELFSVVEGAYKYSSRAEKSRFILLETGWHGSAGGRAMPDAIKGNYVDLKIVREGIVG